MSDKNSNEALLDEIPFHRFRGAIPESYEFKPRDIIAHKPFYHLGGNFLLKHYELEKENQEDKLKINQRHELLNLIEHDILSGSIDTHSKIGFIIESGITAVGFYGCTENDAHVSYLSMYKRDGDTLKPISINEKIKPWEKISVDEYGVCAYESVITSHNFKTWVRYLNSDKSDDALEIYINDMDVPLLY